MIAGLEGATGPWLIATHDNASARVDCCPVPRVALAVRNTRWFCNIPAATGSKVTDVPGIELASERNDPTESVSSVVQYAE